MTTSNEVELMLHFLAQYSLEWIPLSGQHHVFYDAGGKIAAVYLKFEGEAETTPQPEQVLGRSVDANTDGSIYDRVRRPDEGYWICYSRTGGDSPIVTVTIQRMNLNGC